MYEEEKFDQKIGKIWNPLSTLVFTLIGKYMEELLMEFS